MAATPSTMLALGTPAPRFELPDPSGRLRELEEFADAPALVVMFICNHCPYVKHIRHELARTTRELMERGVAVVGINANDIDAYPQDGPTYMAAEAREVGYAFPYLFDESQEVAKAFHAACTPELYVFDRDRKLVYRGQFDDARPGNDEPVTGRDLRAAVEALLEGRAVSPDQKPSVGCSIKWRPGNEPA